MVVLFFITILFVLNYYLWIKLEALYLER